ncbi:hypothetical protein GAR05_06114 [Micromonospora saelicesensis]|uniref:Uncharacterized protein n=1 Tax=Micromonospora saelicesensis TaxID=285676 RepID=A0ABX9CAA2_9ACTN|nr:hypothetical protein [Micromonospora saelicesensis]RAN92622.1 hypothetical protein GAR05_06114 [Micromonospora saelicesensis]
MNGTDRMRATAVATAKETIARQDAAAVAPIKADNFADLRMKLDIATDEELTATLAHWAARTGEIAAEYRLFVQAEITQRQATAALVAEMAPPTRWGTER